ncbi:LacI family DNA-binding transcriptional regulator [Arthrobacter woluwensis]|uniref:LacI family DNA-binding transcriptional regulator n=1 Tax=Arthrobacter woluwensis TaxID=156980 RepID=UPI0021BDD225|nr:LacI family DNA-binding transcriptional regulator [Arthrobacter woluwensis]
MDDDAANPLPGPRAGAGRVTAAMVAREAGVSTATVSLVVSGKAQGRISAANREKVQAAVERLGYVVDTAGSTLSKGFSPVVVLVATDIANPFYAELISEARAALGDRYELLLSVGGPGRQIDAASIRKLLSLRPAGFLIDAPNAELVAALPSGTRAVLLDAPGLQGGLPSVNLDVADGAAQLARHLADQGHRRVVGYLDSTIDAATFRVRRDAFRDTAAELGIEVLDGAASLTDIDAAAEAFTEAWPGWDAAGVTAVVGCTDTHAYGVLGAAAEAGVAVPGRLAVAGFDDLPYSRHTSPPLTSVSLPSGELGSAAGRTLRALIEGGSPETEHVEVPSRLVARASTAAVQGATD